MIGSNFGWIFHGNVFMMAWFSHIALVCVYVTLLNMCRISIKELGFSLDKADELILTLVNVR